MFSLSYNKTQIKNKKWVFFYIIYLDGKHMEKGCNLWNACNQMKEKLIDYNIFNEHSL